MINLDLFCFNVQKIKIRNILNDVTKRTFDIIKIQGSVLEKIH